MAKIAINLLPQEFRVEEVKRAKFYKVQSFGVATILLVIFLSSLTVALRVLQSTQISKFQTRLNQQEQKISDLKNTQASLLLLKNRLTTINEYLLKSSKQAQMYKLIEGLIPPSIFVSSVAVDKAGSVTILASAQDGVSIDNLITSLISKETSKGQVKQVTVENLNRGRDGIYRVSLKIKGED